MIFDLEDKKEKVLATTLEMILEGGIQAASMSKISKKSGVAVGTIYHYFSSKEALITELYRHIKTDLVKRVFSEPEFRENESAKTIFFEVSNRFLTYAKAFPKEYAFIEHYHMSPVIDTSVKETIEETYRFFINDFYKRLRAEAVIREDISLKLLELYINGALSALIKAFIDNAQTWAQDDLDLYLSMIWSGIVGK